MMTQTTKKLQLLAHLVVMVLLSFACYISLSSINQTSNFAVTGASRGYAFVEYEIDREMRRAYEVSSRQLGF
jgi:hypothetical protein